MRRPATMLVIQRPATPRRAWRQKVAFAGRKSRRSSPASAALRQYAFLTPPRK